MKPEEIKQLAQKERERQLKLQKQISKEEPAPKSYIPVSPESWHIYTKIYPGKFRYFFWVVSCFILATTLLFLYWLEKSNWMLWVGLLLLTTFTIRVVVFYIIKLIRYHHFKTWRTNLPFRFTGWEILGQREDFPGFEQWNLEVTLRVKLKQKSIPQEIHTLLKDALYLFVSEANKCFYEPNSIQDGFFGDIRKKWTFKETLIVTGSANAAVIGDIYVCVDKYLRSIQNSYQIIESVDLWFNESVYTVRTVDVD